MSVELGPEAAGLAAGSRIERIETTVVNVPLDAPYRWAVGEYGGASKVVVEVKTHDGILGLGEAPHWRHAALINEELAPRLIGMSAGDLRACWTRAVPSIETLRNTDVPDVVRAYGAIEMALWDIRARAAGVPLFQFLGGAARRLIPFTEYFSARVATSDYAGVASPGEIAASCVAMIEEYDSPFFEGKVGYSDLATDVAIVQEVREAIGPERLLRVDANMGWTLNTARAALAELAQFGVSNVEDPASSFEDMAQLRRHSAIPFSTHLPDLRRAAALGVPDTFVLNITALGGIERTRRFIAACEANGLGFWFYSGDTGIGTAAYLHLAAADPWVREPSQSLLRWYSDDVIEGGPFVPKGGHVAVPEGHGLGVTLDRAAVKRCHEHFRDHGPIEQLGVSSEAGEFRQLPRY